MDEKTIIEAFQIQEPDSVDVLSPDFDRAAYVALLMEKHAKTMQEPESERTWEVKPETLDLYSPEFDPEAFTDERIKYAKARQKINALIEKLATIEPGTDNGTAQRARDVATMQGALTSIKGYLSVPSMPDFEDIFSPNRVKILPTGSTITDESGEVTPPNETEIADAWKTNAAKMAALLSMATPSYEDGETRIQVYLPTICRELTIDPRKYSSLRSQDERTLQEQRFEAFAKWIRPLEGYMLLLNGVYYRACVIESYDKASETVTINPPFFLRLLEAVTQTQVEHSQLNKYFHADVANEENEVAIAVAFYLANKLLQRGQRNPNERPPKFTYRITYATLISKCPQLNKALSDIMQRTKTPGKPDTRTRAYNDLLKAVFETAYRIILEKSDFPQLFVDLKINGVSQWEDPASKKKRLADPKKGNRRTASKQFCIPTKTKLNSQLRITHNGKNAKYARSE